MTKHPLYSHSTAELHRMAAQGEDALLHRIADLMAAGPSPELDRALRDWDRRQAELTA
jgi:hypothetical protein